MIGRFRMEGTNWIFDGYPEGSSIVMLQPAASSQRRKGEHRANGSQEVREFIRLVLYKGDLEQIISWCGVALNEQLEFNVREAAATAAVVRFVTCFEATGGWRAKPLKARLFFETKQRAQFERIKVIRNRMVAHDDALYTQPFGFLAIGSDALAIEALCVDMAAPLFAMEELSGLASLAGVTLAWVGAAVDKAAAVLVDEFNSLEEEDRREIKRTCSGSKIQIVDGEDRITRQWKHSEHE